MALPTFQLLKHRSSAQNAVYRYRCFCWNSERRSRFFLRPPWRPSLHKRDQIGALLGREGSPLRHVSSDKPSRDCVVQIFVGWQSTGRSGTAFECSFREIPWLGIDPRSVITLSVAIRTVTPDAKPPVQFLTVVGMARDAIHMTLFGFNTGSAEVRAD